MTRAIPAKRLKGNELETAPQLEKLDWFPLYVYVLMSDEMWERPDYEFGWYIKLLVRSVHSKRRGYLLVTSDLWKLAGARSEQFFKAKNVALMARFNSVTIDGQTFIYNSKLLKVLTEQSTKYRRNSQEIEVIPLSLSVIDFEELRKAVQRLFSFYVDEFKRRSHYTLTKKREDLAMVRLHELMQENGGNLTAAEALAHDAIDRLSHSDWNRKEAMVDWVDQIFKTQEEFQKRLCMKRQEIKKTSASVGCQGEVPEFDWAKLTEEERYAWADLHWRNAGKDESRIPEHMRPYLKLKAKA